MTTLQIAMAPDLDGIDGTRRGWAIASVLGAMGLVVLNAAIVNVALPTIGTSLEIEPALAVRVITAYQLGLVTMLLPAAALGERLGFRRVFAAGAAVFTGASVLCAFSPSLTWLVAARFVQGLGGAAIMALGVAMLRFIVSQDRFGAAIGWNAMTVALSTAAGPILGSMMLSIAPWPWLFAVTLPIGIGVLAAARSLPSVEGTSHPVPLASVALNACFFALLVFVAEWALSRPVLAVIPLVGAMVCATVLIRREAGCPVPLIPLDLLRRPSFRIAVLASILCFVGQTMGLVALPFYFQNALGLTPLMTGLYLTPWPLMVAVAGPLAGRLADHVRTAWLCLAGGAFLALGLATVALLPLHGQRPVLASCIMLCGLGFGLFNVPNNRTMFLSVPRARGGAAGGLQGMARLTGQTAGAVMIAGLFSLSPVEVAPRIGLALGAALALAAGLTGMARSSPASKPPANPR